MKCPIVMTTAIPTTLAHVVEVDTSFDVKVVAKKLLSVKTTMKQRGVASDAAMGTLLEAQLVGKQLTSVTTTMKTTGTVVGVEEASF